MCMQRLAHLEQVRSLVPCERPHQHLWPRHTLAQAIAGWSIASVHETHKPSDLGADGMGWLIKRRSSPASNTQRRAAALSCHSGCIKPVSVWQRFAKTSGGQVYVACDRQTLQHSQRTVLPCRPLLSSLRSTDHTARGVLGSGCYRHFPCLFTLVLNCRCQYQFALPDHLPHRTSQQLRQREVVFENQISARVARATYACAQPLRCSAQ